MFTKFCEFFVHNESESLPFSPYLVKIYSQKKSQIVHSRKITKFGGKKIGYFFVNIRIFTMFGECDQNFTKFGVNNITTFSFTKFCDIINTRFVTKFDASPKFSRNQQTTEFSSILVNLIKRSSNLVKIIPQH